MHACTCAPTATFLASGRAGACLTRPAHHGLVLRGPPPVPIGPHPALRGGLSRASKNQMSLLNAMSFRPRSTLGHCNSGDDSWGLHMVSHPFMVVLVFVRGPVHLVCVRAARGLQVSGWPCTYSPHGCPARQRGVYLQPALLLCGSLLPKVVSAPVFCTIIALPSQESILNARLSSFCVCAGALHAPVQGLGHHHN